jgi:hypothetical protein
MKPKFTVKINRLENGDETIITMNGVEVKRFYDSNYESTFGDGAYSMLEFLEEKNIIELIEENE